LRRASERRATTATNISIRDLPLTLRRTFIAGHERRCGGRGRHWA
jgi:hypothetical protein